MIPTIRFQLLCLIRLLEYITIVITPPPALSQSDVVSSSRSLLPLIDYRVRIRQCCSGLPAMASSKPVDTSIHASNLSEDAGLANSSSVPKLDNVECGSWKDAPNSTCHASFGDKGTTATVGAFGQLLQFSDFLGAGSSGMFSVDHKGVDGPYQVQGRAWELHARSQQPFHFGPPLEPHPPYGLRFPDLVLKSSVQPRLTWTDWRWPRHEYSREDFNEYSNLKLVIQWMVHKHTVLQRCLLENLGNDIQLNVEVSKAMTIADLDHLDHESKFNEPDASYYSASPGPQHRTWVCVHRFCDTKDESETAGSRDSTQDSAFNVEPDPSRNRVGSSLTTDAGM